MRIRDIGLVIGMAIVSLYATGCGADCESLCEDGKECSGATAEQKKVDCAKSCSDFEAAAEKAGCTDEYDDSLSCASDQDVCKPSTTACKAEGEALGKCLGTTTP